MELLQTWLTPAAVGAALAFLVQHWLQRRQDRDKRILDVRFEQYQRYLVTLETIAQATNAEFQSRILQAMPSHLARILADPNNSNDVLVEMSQDLSMLISRMSEGLSKASNELQGLRLVCSPRLLEMVEEYVEIQRQLFVDASNLLNSFQGSAGAGEVPSPPPGTSERARDAEMLLQEIVRQMRKELGTDR